MGPGERDAFAADGKVIEVRISSLSIWPKWLALWRHRGEWFGGPWDGEKIAHWDHAPTDAEVLAEYEAWKTEVEARR